MERKDCQAFTTKVTLVEMIQVASPTHNDNQTKSSRKYKLGKFEGPLDLLLFLVRKNEVNIHDIPIAEITEQYLEYLKYEPIFNIKDVAEFHLMAATLLHIKSRMLLPLPPSSLEEEFNDPRSELVQRLIEYEKIRKFTNLMIEKQLQNKWIIERKHSQPILPFPNDEQLWQKIDTWALFKSFSKIMNSIGREGLINIWEEVSVGEKITLINEYIEKNKEFQFDELISNPSSIVETISSFLAVLEMVKARLINVFQNQLFGDIRILPYSSSE